MKKIVFTGGGSAGHVTPNLAIIAKLKLQGWDIQYIGSQQGIEREIIGQEGIPFHPIASGKLRRYFDFKNMKDPFNVIRGVGQAYRLLRKLKPDVVFSKGGFVSVPVILASKLNRIPIIIHESDMTPGLANKISLPFADQVCVTFPESLKHIKGNKAICTGLPIREHILLGNAMKGLQLCDFHQQKPILLVMGGSLGAQRINSVVRAALDVLLQSYQIVHLCGKGHVDEAFQGRRGYRQFEYLNEDLPDVLAMTNLVVSRAGATSIFEFLALEKPMLLIPLTKQASRGDQILNAGSFQSMGYGEILFEEQLTADTLIQSIELLHLNQEKYVEKAKEAKHINGTDAIIKLIKKAAHAAD
ncbi:undecaprenyldiphospho-muramoylpentapeptide beta-N-acetylglucosaminyltransferase [Paenibacillus sp. WQ 127069]|uniref:UDP-N-acetylglucosamine--N-acetylmuramyl-(pentapeptide) pyrophosphoryl-undecaprenol N-acetylglucosamine transferase n=1 Tax=Paenibacillus baimaensis TaxID=2982185 RepID=A0ABT2UMF1_9BACL|nr:undecaprenyldiphospho-muramoylpentapeptide beta-N-acetylglucosaminyltransferase [Paenibacillus sp. WQ 127069]MCU6795757.1 undecaprenyldiphospho-muramoylpentapeptide beta-N-acetylglucosaminyltransferase [Paenibacillus sp. WQ 127069]